MQIVSHITAEIIREIGTGEGRNSVVYLARDPQLGGDVAVKVIPVTQFAQPNEYFQEAQNLFRSKHPRVIPIQYACRDKDEIRLVMPFFSNGSLQGYLDRQGVPTIKQTIKWAQQFLSGLHHIHIRRLIHFDIKPTNIMLDDAMSAMVADFGQARPIDQLGLAQLPLLYRYHFPPEALQQSVASQSADIYQCGLTLYRLVNGNQVFRAQIPRTLDELRIVILAGDFPDRDLFLPHVPKRMKTVIRKALHVDPTRRFQTATDLMTALGKVDTLLDWSYSSVQDGHMWLRRAASHQYCIFLRKVGTSWSVKGHTQANGKVPRRRDRWCAGPFRTENQALRAVHKMFAEEE